MSQTAQTMRIRGLAEGLERKGGDSDRSREDFLDPDSCARFKPIASAASASARSSRRLSERRAMDVPAPDYQPREENCHPLAKNRPDKIRSARKTSNRTCT